MCAPHKSCEEGLSVHCCDTHLAPFHEVPFGLKVDTQDTCCYRCREIFVKCQGVGCVKMAAVDHYKVATVQCVSCVLLTTLSKQCNTKFVFWCLDNTWLFFCRSLTPTKMGGSPTRNSVGPWNRKKYTLSKWGMVWEWLAASCTGLLSVALTSQPWPYTSLLQSCHVSDSDVCWCCLYLRLRVCSCQTFQLWHWIIWFFATHRLMGEQTINLQKFNLSVWHLRSVARSSLHEW